MSEDPARDLRYGRQGGRWLPKERKRAKVGASVGRVRPEDLAAHLAAHHPDLAGQDPSREEREAWHAADHRYCGADEDHTHRPA